jgi:hypothetical protein
MTQGMLASVAAHGQSATSQHRRIPHRRLDIVVAQPCVHRPDLVALLEQMRRNAVPNGMTTEACGEPCRRTGPAHGALHTTLMGMMPADDPCTGVFRPLVGGKPVWPEPQAVGTGVWSCQGERYKDGAIPLGDVWRMDAVDTRSMFLEWADQAGGPHGDPSLHAIAIAHDALLWGAIEVCRASLQACHPSHGHAVELGGHSRIGSGDGSHHLQGFRRGQHRRHVCGFSGTDGLDGPVERLSEHLAGEAQQGAEGLVLGGGGDLLLHGEVRQKRLDVCASHVFGMACAVEEHIPLDPGDRRVLRMPRIVHESNGGAHVVEPFLGTWFHGIYLPEIMR